MTFHGSYPPQGPQQPGPQGPADPVEAKNQARRAKNRRQVVASAPWLAAVFFLLAAVLVVAMFGETYSQDGRNLGRLIAAVWFVAFGILLLVIRRLIRRQDRERGSLP